MSTKNFLENETRKKLIDPVLQQAWWEKDDILEEVSYESIEIINNKPVKRWWRVDYLLCISKNNVKFPIAVLEAKSEWKTSLFWLEQAKQYSKRFNVKFAISTNWKFFSVYDDFSKQIQYDLPMKYFPSKEYLQELYETKQWFKLESKKFFFVPYSGKTNKPRYYQDAAIRATLEKIAKWWKRVLLTLATWAGKTTLAVQLIYKLIKSQNARKILFLCDRNTLALQAYWEFSKVFKNDVVLFSKDARFKNAKIIVATYQSLKLDWDNIDESYFSQHFPNNYFSHIIIDECHRSAWWKWFYPMQVNPEAVHIWLTATPKKIDVKEENEELNQDLKILEDNFKYFWEPVYEYTIAQWQKDGYLAQCEIVPLTLNIDKEVYTKDEILKLNPIDTNTGKQLWEEDLKDKYTAKDLDKFLIIPSRTKEFAKSLMEQLKKYWWYEQKTIVFCSSDLQADYIAAELNNLYYKSWWNPNVKHFAFKFTSNTFLEKWDNAQSQETLKADFAWNMKDYFIATTVDLLSTGVDIKPLQNIVFFRYLNSPILFYQMVGRWTRLNPPTNKYMFRIFDYTNATRLFWKDFIAKYVKPKEEPTTTWWWINRISKARIQNEDGLNAPKWYQEQEKYILIDEKRIPISEYIDNLVKSILADVKDTETLKQIWLDKEKRENLIKSLYAQLGSFEELLELLDLKDKKDEYDFYDIVRNILFKESMLTKSYRASHCKTVMLSKILDNDKRKIYNILLSQYEKWWLQALENRELFEVPELREKWWLLALKKLWNPKEVLENIKRCLLSI